MGKPITQSLAEVDGTIKSVGVYIETMKYLEPEEVKVDGFTSTLIKYEPHL